MGDPTAAWASMGRTEVLRSGGWVARPLTDGRELPLARVRAGPGERTPVLAIPGGPGLASVLPYRGLRRAAARRGLDVIMMEHRGVGFSRRDSAGTDLTVDDVTSTAAADDLAAVLDAAGVQQAVVYGTSYGSYLAQLFGIRHPDRVAAMVLDAPGLDAGDMAEVRAHLRALFWDGLHPATARCAALVRELAAAGEEPLDLSCVVQHVYEFAGTEPLERLLEARLRGRAGRSWARIARLGRAEVESPTGQPLVFEPDLVRPIGQGELGFDTPPDGHVLDPQRLFALAPASQPRTPPYDIAAELERFTWPVAVVSGDRDLRSPRPVAERVVALLPDAVLVPLVGHGHSALDTHRLAALNVAHVVEAGAHRALPALAARLSALPRRGASALLGPLLRAGIAVDTRLPAGSHPRAADHTP
ncbi:alpha/beta fold hydrolase [Pseudonocardia sp. NPDC049635]|uniref:alpha/beta fold hydrolase n=1 Tax=Pseudonocardia sp. NPDC049635 TaxID=3155506 RepID=UPI0033D7EA85